MRGLKYGRSDAPASEWITGSWAHLGKGGMLEEGAGESTT